MDGANGTALEWALALLSAPAERYRLRQRPLPPGVGELLAVAASVAPDATDVALPQRGLLQTGESAATLREAARFYAREILFHADADAYRTLGVAADAPAEQIKANHRLLQVWLHPDRQYAGDDSIFAARVNAAWNQLRSEDRRRAYDAERAAATGRAFAPAPAATRPDARPLPAAVWHPQPGTPAAFTRKRHRALVAGLLGICLLLGWLALRQSLREPEPWGFDIVDAAVPAADRPADMSLRHEGAESAETAPLRRDVDAAAPAPLPVLPPELDLPPVPLAAEDVAPLTTALPVTPPPAVPPVPVERVELAWQAGAAHAARHPVQASFSTPLPAAPAVAASPAALPPTPVVAANPAPTIRRPPPDAATAAADPTEAVQQDSLFGRLRQVFGRRSQARTELGPGAEGDEAYARIQQARQVGQQLMHYLVSDSRTPPPIWASASALDRADGLRRDLRQLGATRLGAPQWRIGQTHGSLRSPYRVAGSSQGSVVAALAWRDDRWLVTSVALEAGP
ncbi:MAG: DnaJ domain-containing protein [Thermomonas sp.]|uniref:J domain-containing protein n=1 Tax=Thermomonas sp. TaxID=1971895 RepID=UPI002629D63B|nr:DnaJ domain-containing protein [Thermomonas sp.]MCC7096503.1 DnaJ domain-containing protein [Thermomonas sp.]